MSDGCNHDLLRSLRARLELDAGLGVRHVVSPAAWPKPSSAGEKRVRPSAASSPRRPAPRAEAASAQPPPLPEGYVSLVPYAPPASNPEKEAMLADLHGESLCCEDCELCRRRTRVAWGEGSLDAGVMFIGEGPGRDEDREGRPFVGRSGRLLTDIIEKGMKLARSEVYIANVVKCRPPGNRDPRPEEVAACSRYLHRQIEVIAPRVIVAVGGVAGCALLGLPPRSGGLRGKWHIYRGVPLRVIYHPSYLLRLRRSEHERTDADRQTWNDIQEVMARMASI